MRNSTIPSFESFQFWGSRGEIQDLDNVVHVKLNEWLGEMVPSLASKECVIVWPGVCSTDQVT